MFIKLRKACLNLHSVLIMKELQLMIDGFKEAFVHLNGNYLNCAWCNFLKVLVTFINHHILNSINC